MNKTLDKLDHIFYHLCQVKCESAHVALAKEHIIDLKLYVEMRNKPKIRQAIAITEDYPDMDKYKKILIAWAVEKGITDYEFEYHKFMGKITGICIHGDAPPNQPNP